MSTSTKKPARNAKKRKAGVDLYVDRTGAHRWRVTATNGEKVANGGQGYSRKIDRLEGMRIAANALIAHLLENGCNVQFEYPSTGDHLKLALVYTPVVDLAKEAKV